MMEDYFEKDIYQWLNNTHKNKLCVNIKNQHYDEFQLTISYTQEQLFYTCSCDKKNCFHLHFLIYMLNQNYEKKLHHHYFDFDEDIDNYLYLPIMGSQNNKYGVEIKVDSTKTFTYLCSCGLKYTRKKRKKCKHITKILDTIQNEFRKNHEIDTSLEEYFEQLSICK